MEDNGRIKISPAWAAIIVTLIIAMIAAITGFGSSIQSEIIKSKEADAAQVERIARLEATYEGIQTDIRDIKSRLARIEEKIDRIR